LTVLQTQLANTPVSLNKNKTVNNAIHGSKLYSRSLDTGTGERKKVLRDWQQSSSANLIRANFAFTGISHSKNITRPANLGNSPIQQIIQVEVISNNTPNVTEIWSCHSDGTITVWNCESHESKTTFNAHAGKRINHMLVIEDVVWSTGQDQLLKIWKPSSKECISTVKLTQVVNAWCASGKYVYAFLLDNTLALITKKKVKVKKKIKLSENIKDISAAVYVAHKKQIWAGGTKCIYVLDEDSTNLIGVIEDAHKDRIHCLTAVGTEVWSCSSDKHISIWNDEGELLKTLTGHSSRVFSVAALGIEYVWSVSWDMSLMIWNAQNQQFIQEYKGKHTDAVCCVVGVTKNAMVEEVWAGSWDGAISVFTLKDPVSVTQPNLYG